MCSFCNEESDQNVSEFSTVVFKALILVTNWEFLINILTQINLSPTTRTTLKKRHIYYAIACAVQKYATYTRCLN
jgi:hypothetical protein